MHKTIKRKDNFVDKKNRSIHTQNIESRWELIKNMMKKRGCISRIGFESTIKEIIWKVTNKDNLREKLLEILIKKINQ